MGVRTACVDCRNLRVAGSEAAGKVSCCSLMPPGLGLCALCPCGGAMRRPNHNWVLPHTSVFHLARGRVGGYVMCSRGPGVLITGGRRNTGSMGT